MMTLTKIPPPGSSRFRLPAQAVENTISHKGTKYTKNAEYHLTGKALLWFGRGGPAVWLVVRTASLLLLLAAVPAMAQLQVFTVQGADEKPVTGIVTVGTTGTGEPIDTLFRVKNTLPSLALLSINITGDGYSLQQVPAPPALPGLTSLDFYVRFQSAQPLTNARGTLTINSATITIVATATAAPALTVVNDDGTSSPRVAGQSTVFLPVGLGGQSTRRFVLTNPFATTLSVGSLAVTGASFKLAAGVPASFSLGASQSRNVDIVFQPAATGLQKGELVIDQRHYLLEGQGNQAQLPRPVLSYAAESFQSGKQVRIAVKFESAAPADGAGQLRFDFQPSVTGPSDPAISFPSGTRTSIPFIVRTGETQALFSGQPDVLFQTGTTAGVLRFTAEMGGYQTTGTVTIQPAPVTVDSVIMVKRVDAVEVTVKGFDNTRTASRMIFTFYDAAGAKVQPGDLTSDVSQAFRRYYDTTEVGGSFSLRALFSATTTTVTIQEGEIQIQNSAGVTVTSRFR